MNTPAISPADRLVLRQGTIDDYAALGAFHYLRNKPGTATRVLVLDDPSPPIASRILFRNSGEFRNRCAGAVPGLQSAAGDPRSPVAVLVESYPSLSCSLRNIATRRRYAGWSDRAAAGRLLNAEVRCISRVVVHPQWRGLGLAVRLVRHALQTATTPYVESLAAMGRVHPFFELAGMTAYRRHPHPPDQRLLDAMRHAGVETWELASERRMLDHAARSPVLARQLRRWAGKGTTIERQIGEARERLLCEPVYYLKRIQRVD